MATRWHPAMRLALEQAEAAARHDDVPIGAVVLDPSGAVIARAGNERELHADPTAHAEVVAIRRAAEAVGEWRLTDCTLVVTLEPCRLSGRTGPCVRAILDAGIGRVVYAAADPTPNAGGGRELAAAGVEVHADADPASAGRLNVRWELARAAGRPFVTAHLAQSLDAKVADAQGRGRWITSPQAREHSHAVRARVGAIVVGTGTVLADDPALTVRLPGEPERELPVVVAGASPVPATHRLAVRAAEGGAVVRVPDHDPLSLLTASGADHVLLEGGPTLLAAFIDADLVDELYLYVAPVFLGPGVDATGALAARPVHDPVRWNPDPAGHEPERLGPDLLLHLSPAA